MDSTNNYAMAKAAAGLSAHGTLYFAHDQWAGKGQRGRTWSSKPGENIILSVVLEPVALAPSQTFALSASVALACYDFLSIYTGAEATRIKWPNDLYWRDRKAGGILIENNFRGDRWAYAIAGIGININQTEFPETARNPVSLRQITGRSFDPVVLARELGACLDRRYNALLAGNATSGSSGIPGDLETPGDTGIGGIAGTSGDTGTGGIPGTSGGPSSSGDTGIPGMPGPSRDSRVPSASGIAGTSGGSGISGILAQYNARLYRLGQEVRLRKGNVTFDTVITGVSPQGRLLTKDVLEREFSFGEVEWII